MSLKSKKAIPWPDMEKIKDNATKIFGEDLGNLLLKTFRDVYDDLNLLRSNEKVTALPTAGVDYRGQIFILDGGAGVADTVKICIKEEAGTYAWKEITLT